MSGSATIPASISSCDAALSASLADNASAGAVIKAARTETVTSALETIASSGGYVANASGILDVVGSGGYVTSSAALDLVDSGGYITSSGATTLVNGIISSGGYTTSAYVSSYVASALAPADSGGSGGSGGAS